MKHVSRSDLRRTFAKSIMIPFIFLVVDVSRLALSQVPPAVAQWYVGPPFNSPTNPNYFGTDFPINLTSTTNIPGVASHTANVYTYPGHTPSVGASASASTSAIGSQGSAYRVFAQFWYYFKLAGPPGQYVPINFSATGNASAPPVGDPNNPPYAIAEVRFWDMQLGNVYVYTTVSNNNSFNIFQQKLEVIAERVNALYVRAEVYVGGSSSPTPTGSASVDPTITIDPSFAQADQYKIVWSPNLFQVGFSNIAIAGNNLVFNATNGAAEGTYILLTSTNLTIPFSDWSPVTTNTLESDGNFSMTLTNAVSSNTGRKYFTLKLQ